MASWIGIACSFVLWAVTIAKMYGYDESRMENMEKEIDRGFKYDAEHFQHAKDDQVHFADTELHWTGRSRDDLNRRLDLQDAQLAKILDRLMNPVIRSNGQ